MFEKAEKFIIENALICEGDRVLAALSGGADSVYLFLTLLNLQKKLGFELCAAHVNHNLRGEASDADERFCSELSRRHNVKLYTLGADVKGRMKEKNESLETAARNIRYDWFESLCAVEGFNKIAVAHNSDDNAETVLMHMIRGCAPDAISGILPRNGKIIRPILCVSRKEIEDELCKAEQTFVTDKTNFEADCTRNKIRLVCLKYIRENINPSVCENISRLAYFARLDAEYMNKQVDGIYEKAVNGGKLIISEYTALPEAIALRVMKKYVSDYLMRNTDISYDTIIRCHEAVISGKTAKKIPVGSDDFFSVFSDYAIIGKNVSVRYETVRLKAGESVNFGKYEIFADIVSKRGRSSKFTEYFDMTNTDFVTVRTRKNGDIFKPFSSGRKKLGDFLTDMKIPISERDEIPLIESEGKILWVCGVRRSDYNKVSDSTKNILRIKITEG